MAENNISLQADEMRELTVLVAEALIGGESREQVVADLAQNGLGDEAAEEIVSNVEHQLYQVETPTVAVDDGNGGLGWLIWIAIAIGAKLFSVLAQ